jgi:hypothetical protein
VKQEMTEKAKRGEKKIVWRTSPQPSSSSAAASSPHPSSVNPCEQRHHSRHTAPRAPIPTPPFPKPESRQHDLPRPTAPPLQHPPQPRPPPPLQLQELRLLRPAHQTLAHAFVLHWFALCSTILHCTLHIVRTVHTVYNHPHKNHGPKELDSIAHDEKKEQRQQTTNTQAAQVRHPTRAWCVVQVVGGWVVDVCVCVQQATNTETPAAFSRRG